MILNGSNVENIVISNGKEEQQSYIDYTQLLFISDTLLHQFKPNNLENELLESQSDFLPITASERVISREVDARKLNIKVSELSSTAQGTNIIIANGGAGKSSVLWSIASKLAEHEYLIPIFIPIKDFPSVTDINKFINELSSGNGLRDIVKLENVVFLLDGLNDISGGVRQDSEIRKLLSLLSNSISIITSRPLKMIINATYWDLELLDANQVNDYLSNCNLSTPNKSQHIVDILRYPLMLILYVSMRGRVNNVSTLFQEYFFHITNDFTSPVDILKSVSETTATAYYNNELNSYSAFNATFKSNYKKHSGDEFCGDISSLGILSKKNNHISPIHDLYWEWLVGCGVLFDWSENKRHVECDLNLRKCIYISLGTSMLPLPSESELTQLVDLDIILSSYFLKEVNENFKYTGFKSILELKLHEKLSSPLAFEAFRAIKSVFISCNGKLLSHAFGKLNSLTEMKFKVNSISEVINDDFIWQNKCVVLDYLKNNELPYVIMFHIENMQSDRWGLWSEETFLCGEIKFNQASRIYFSSSKKLPTWIRNNFKSIEQLELIYSLRNAARLGVNEELAKWLYENFNEIADLSKGGSLVFNIMDVIEKCGNQTLIEQIVSDYFELDEKKQEYFIFLFEKVHLNFLLPLKHKLFDSALRIHEKSKLFSILVNEFSDVEIEVWINSENERYSDLGWSAIAKSKGLEVLERIIDSLPASYAGVHMIPPLRALHEIDNLPHSIEDVLMSKLGSPMQPMATQDFILAMSNIKPHGILRVMNMILQSPHMMGTYHFGIFLKEYSKWSRVNKCEIMAVIDGRNFKFIDGILYLNLKCKNDELERWTELALSYTSDPQVFSVIKDNVASKLYFDDHFSRFKPKVFSESICNVVATIYGINCVYNLYKEMLDKLPSHLIEELFTLYSGKKQREFDAFLYSVSTFPRKESISYYEKIIEISIQANKITHENVSYYLEILSPLDRNEVVNLIQCYNSDIPDVVNNFIRTLEERMGVQIVEESLNLK